MNKEYIEREAVLKELDSLKADIKLAMLGVYKAVDAVPAADVAPVVHGKWEFHKDGSGTCNQCHFTQKNVWDYDNAQRYCGVCGARMDGVAEND